MSAAPATKLYSPAILGLATGLAAYPFDPALPFKAEARSRSCGSVIAIGLALDDAGRVAKIGLKVSACAIGQASAALMAEGVIGADPAHLAATTQAIEGWLTGKGTLPHWPGIDALEPAIAHPGRHGALLLPWKAACMALSSGTAGG